MHFENTSLPFVSENEYGSARGGVQSIGRGMEKPVQCPGVRGREVEVAPTYVNWASTVGGQRKTEAPQGRTCRDLPSPLNPGFCLYWPHLSTAYIPLRSKSWPVF